MRYKLPDRLSRLQIAVAATVDERTLNKALRGEKVQSTTLARVKQVLEQRGEAHLLGACE